MPGGDRTGPRGDGSATGRAVGYCVGYPVPGYANQVRGFGRGRGRGYGRGWGRGWYSYPPAIIVPPINLQAYTPTIQPQIPEQEVAALENYHKNLTSEKADLDQELEGVKARIEELKAKLGNK
jgi:hypothetical protein